MPKIEKFIVIPFRKGRKNQLMTAEMRQARSAEAAGRMAKTMAERFAGVATYAVVVDNESGDLLDPKLLQIHGETLDVLAEA